MSDNGDAVIVWGQKPTALSTYNLFKSEYRNGTWHHPSFLDYFSYNSTVGIGADDVAMSGNGNTIITWSAKDYFDSQIFKSEYRNGIWSHPIDLNDNISPDWQRASGSQVAMSDIGNSIIAWSQSDGSNNQIFKSEYRNGIWSHPIDLNDNISPDGENAFGSQVAMSGNGDAIIAWSQNDGSNDQIFKSEYWPPPIVETILVSKISDLSALGGGNVISNENKMMVTNRGVCWSEVAGVTIADNCTHNGEGGGVYESIINGLSCYTTYYTRAYATNAEGTSYGNEVLFTTSGPPTPGDSSKFPWEMFLQAIFSGTER